MVFGQLVALTDDKHTQPANNIALPVHNDLLAKVDRTRFEAILNAVSAKMTTAELTQLNAEYVFLRRTSRRSPRSGLPPTDPSEHHLH